ncbi:uncharacterized protein LOC113309933 [Papaver somniferum]|uniref:uncharacterized protein LOC113309933 n=1 Tax=Papaver somniferum TaxID=3469 RepID=UPI000E703D5C|nr:uncharacterized protein LOC113309933 [Papaver somniferum]
MYDPRRRKMISQIVVHTFKTLFLLFLPSRIDDCLLVLCITYFTFSNSHIRKENVVELSSSVCVDDDESYKFGKRSFVCFRKKYPSIGLSCENLQKRAYFFAIKVDSQNSQRKHQRVSFATAGPEQWVRQR